MAAEFGRHLVKNIRKPDTKSVRKMTVRISDCSVFGGLLYYVFLFVIVDVERKMAIRVMM
jgi:hypothetical protein